ncbi:J domain-containing protein [Sphingomonas qilianensis]|uniref:J domain-containing protein n=1 Tax=Sphingomonas qilianensis TaxID=1736690 RepID=A0ABU9XR51_9SPHN
MSKIILVALILLAGWLLLRRTTKTERLSETEARSILGVDAGADAAAVRAAHRRLVSAVHPDKGGSADLTRRINAARDTLLKR